MAARKKKKAASRKGPAELIISKARTKAACGTRTGDGSDILLKISANNHGEALEVPFQLRHHIVRGALLRCVHPCRAILARQGIIDVAGSDELRAGKPRVEAGEVQPVEEGQPPSAARNLLPAGVQEAGAECLVTDCPLCQSNLDTRQAEIEAERETSFNLPVFYVTELMALAFGDEQVAGWWKGHFVDPRPLLSGKGLA